MKLTVASSHDLSHIESALTEFNQATAPDVVPYGKTALNFVYKDADGHILAGIEAHRNSWGLLKIDILYVTSKLRFNGLGTQLLQHVEELALEADCKTALVSTYDFQAKYFYIKSGFSVFGSVENTPPGHTRYFLKKELKAKDKDS